VAIGKLIIDHISGNKIIQLKDFKYSRYLKTSDKEWEFNIANKKLNFN
jgi:hypothetical protein